MTRRRLLIAFGLVLLFLAAHVPFLPASLEDIDSINFALGMRDFDPVAHRPHPPGSPLFIALGKLSSRWLAGEARALAVWGVLFGALSVFPLLQLFRGLDDGSDPEARERLALAATVLTITCPLFWFSAARPMSDVPGLAATLLAQALLVSAFRSGQPAGTAAVAGSDAGRRALMLGALVAGLAIGLRSQSFWLTVPVLLVVLADRGLRGDWRTATGSALAYSAGVLLWGVPLLVASGGAAAYLDALGRQAREDLTGVDMLATNPTLGRLAAGLFHTFVLPWSAQALAVTVLLLGLAGCAVMAARARTGLFLLAVAVGPYLLFHLGFHETVTTRYALPVVPAVAYLAARGVRVISNRGLLGLSGAIAFVSVAITWPAVATYARRPSPLFQAVAGVRTALDRADAERPLLAMHGALSVALRGERWRARRLPSPPRREWSEVMRYWRHGGTRPIWFLADARRRHELRVRDFATIDPSAFHIRRTYAWAFDARNLLGGVRPSGVDWYEIAPPRWLVGPGWALTPEAAGLADARGRSPAAGPIGALVRRTAEAVVLMIGGRNLGQVGEPDVRFDLEIDGRPFPAWVASPSPGFFLRHWMLPSGFLSGPGRYARLTVRGAAADESGRQIRAAIEQFNLQPVRSAMLGFDRGWHELEHNPGTSRLWRWSSGSSALWIHSGGRDVTLSLTGESPLRYFSAAPTIVVRAGATTLGTFAPAADFSIDVRVPAGALDAAGGLVTVETNRTFVPDLVYRNGDRRRLGLRIWDASVR